MAGSLSTWLQGLRRRVAEALYPFGSDPDPDAGDYRRLTSSKLRDLDPLSQAQMLRVCRFLYDGQPLSGWIVDQRVDLLLGDELGFSVEIDAVRLKLSPASKATLEAEIKRTLSRFWEHPVFNFKTRADELLTSLMVDGEICLPLAGANPVDGVPTIDFVDSGLIEKVLPLPGSSIVMDKVQLKTDPGTPPKTLSIVRFNPKTQRLEGDCFYWRNSRLVNSMRGRSELLRVADWVDALDQFLFARADRAAILNAMIWDVSLEGANDSQVKAKRQEIEKNPPTKPGSIRIHNEKETWNAVVPDLKASDATDEVKLLRNYILGSKSMPESWFSDGGSTTRTTADSQNDVSMMALRAWRRRVKAMFETVLHFAYDQAQAKQGGVFPSRAGGGVAIKVDLPPLTEKDVSRLGGVVQNLAASLEAAVAAEFCSKRTARKVFLNIVDRLGVPVDPDDEEQQIDAEEADREEAAAAKAQDAAAAGLAPMLDQGAADDDEEPATEPAGAAVS
jgi:hypothetical protein